MIDYKLRNPTWKSFYNAKRRCTDKKYKYYFLYGGRGIKFCFSRWEEIAAEIGERPPNHSLDRINTNGNYEKGNIKWSTQKEQCRNRRNFKSTPELAERIKKLYSSGYTLGDIRFLTGLNSYTSIKKAINGGFDAE